MKNYIFLIFLMILWTSDGQAQESLNQKTIDSLMGLSFDEFDQNMEGGWRLYANRMDFDSATQLIKLYLDKHPDLKSNEREVMSFHCGQMLALMDKNLDAIPYMEASKKKNEDVMQWNIYVDATIAFLKKDKEAFSLKIKELEEKSIMPEDQNRNLMLLKRLEESFDKTYADALKL